MMVEEETGKVQIERGEVTPAQMEEIEAGAFLTVKEIANKLQYSYEWVRWMLLEGRIKGIKPLGGRWRIAQSEYDRVIKEGIPPMPREKEKPSVTEIEVGRKVIDKVKEPPVKREPPGVFPFDFSAFGGKE